MPNSPSAFPCLFLGLRHGLSPWPFRGPSVSCPNRSGFTGLYMDFERGKVEPAEVYARLFRDGRAIDGPAFEAHLKRSYRWIDGIEVRNAHWQHERL